MNNEEINILLHRQLKKGTNYNRFMPFSDCSSTKLAMGDTKVAIDNMVGWSLQYQHHTKSLAQQFNSKNLDKLCKELHSFLYHHFQYKIDGYNQQLRSPACAWATRSKGIDCKSYSIFGSTVLNNNGVAHYFRRVVQNEGEGFSHVYIVVPKNQATKDLNDGYYVIDGTLPTMQEVSFYKSDDVYVGDVNGLNGLGNVWGQVINKAIDITKPLVDFAINELLEWFNGCAGSYYDQNVVAMRLERDLKEKLFKKLDELSKAIRYRNRPRTQHLFNDILKEVDLGVYHVRNESAYSFDEHCDNETLDYAYKFAKKIKQIVTNLLNEFIKINPQYEVEIFEKRANVSERTMYFVVENATNMLIGDYRFIIIRPKDSVYAVNPIFPFEKNPTEWLMANVDYLRKNYKDGRELTYKQEVSPLVEEVKKLRSRVHLGGEMLFYAEQSLQAKMYKIWLNFDDKYTDFLKNETLSRITANELALRDYKRRYKQVLSEDKIAKEKKKNKDIIGGAILVSSLLLIASKK